MAEDIIPAMFCRPVKRPRVVARELLDVILLEAQEGTRTAGVKACMITRQRSGYPAYEMHISLTPNVRRKVKK